MKKENTLHKTDYEDVDEVIELAERLRMDDVGRLSPEEMAEVGEELGIPQKYVDQARTKLVKQRADEARRMAAKKASARFFRIGVGIVAAALLLIAGGWAASASSSLGDREAELRAQSAQLNSARERQTSVHALLADRPASPDKDAELIGAENRVRVELKRCNEALSAYQRAASSFPASLWTQKGRLEASCRAD